jgi:anti-sigma factor RsiW
MANDTHMTDRLSSYLDGELDSASRTQVEAHLAQCGDCRDTLRDLRAIVAAAPDYEGRAPARDLWFGIAARIDQTRVVALPTRPAQRLFTLRQLVAASVLLAATAGGLAWVAARRGAGEVSAEAGQAPADPALRLAGLVPRADSAYEGAVADLEQVLVEGRARLDTATVRIIEQNLAVIDQAIAEARAAIAADPANAYLSSQVAANMRRKLDLLRRTAAAIEASAS